MYVCMYVYVNVYVSPPHRLLICYALYTPCLTIIFSVFCCGFFARDDDVDVKVAVAVAVDDNDKYSLFCYLAMCAAKPKSGRPKRKRRSCSRVDRPAYSAAVAALAAVAAAAAPLQGQCKVSSAIAAQRAGHGSDFDVVASLPLRVGRCQLPFVIVVVFVLLLCVTPMGAGTVENVPRYPNGHLSKALSLCASLSLFMFACRSVSFVKHF